MSKRRYLNDLRPGLRLVAAAAAALLAGLAPRQARGGTFERTFTYDAEALDVRDLIGEVQVKGVEGGSFRVTVKVQGEDATADLLKIEERKGSRAQLLVRFPTDEHRKYVYPRLGDHSSSSFNFGDRHGRDHGDDWLDALLSLGTGDRIQVRGHSFGGAIEVWADVIVEVPKGKETQVHLGMGSIEAHDLEGPLQLATKSGEVNAGNIKGDVAIDTGSGSVDVKGVHGDLDVDTGSGGIEVADVSDARTVKLDTGSGGVRAAGVKALRLAIDTGSGHVDLADVDVEDVKVDTGSGGVTGDRLATNGLMVDTGSGGVDMDLVRMGHGRFHVETGSGGIRMHLPHEISADFDVDSGSGGIDADIDGVSLDRRHRREAHFTVGTGDAQVKLSTGSGSVRLVQSR